LPDQYNLEELVPRLKVRGLFSDHFSFCIWRKIGSEKQVQKNSSLKIVGNFLICNLDLKKMSQKQGKSAIFKFDFTEDDTEGW
jgi:hypothetical protein